MKPASTLPLDQPPGLGLIQTSGAIAHTGARPSGDDPPNIQSARGLAQSKTLREFGGRKLFRSFAIVLAILAGYNLLIHFTSRNSQRQHLLGRLAAIPAETDCLFLGNSLVEAGCDASVFKAAWPNSEERIAPINLALGATTPVEHYLILKRALERPLHLKYLVYGFFDDQLNASVNGRWSDLIGNRALSYYFPREAAAFYAPGSRFKQWQLWLTGHIPMLAERSSLWGKVELLRRHFEEIGMPRGQTNRFGRVEDFQALEPKDIVSFNQRCAAIVRNKSVFSPPVRELIRLARQHGAEVILVEMPMPSRHRTVFYSSPAWTEMQDYLHKLAFQERAVYISASDWVTDDANFEDATHLNDQGAQLFSSQLANVISKARQKGNGPKKASLGDL